MENYVRYFIKILVIMVLIALMGLFIVLVKDNTNVKVTKNLKKNIDITDDGENKDKSTDNINLTNNNAKTDVNSNNQTTKYNSSNQQVSNDKATSNDNGQNTNNESKETEKKIETANKSEDIDFSLNFSNKVLEVGKTAQIVVNSDINNLNIKYKSFKTDVATVSESGTIKALKKGTTYIEVNANQRISKVIELVVIDNNKPTSSSINKNNKVTSSSADKNNKVTSSSTNKNNKTTTNSSTDKNNKVTTSSSTNKNNKVTTSSSTNKNNKVTTSSSTNKNNKVTTSSSTNKNDKVTTSSSTNKNNKVTTSSSTNKNNNISTNKTKNGWYTINGKKYYYKNNTKLTNRFVNYIYLDNNGVAQDKIGNFSATLYGAIAWTNRNVNIRREPIENSKLLGTIPTGAKLTILSSDNPTTKYIKISYNGIVGYVYSDFLLINLPDVIPDIVYYIANADKSLYKAANTSIADVTGKNLYGFSKKYNAKIGKNTYYVPLLYPVAKQLQGAYNIAKKDGYNLKIYDTYRPNDVTKYVNSKFRSLYNSNNNVKKLVDYDKNGSYWGPGWFLANNVSTHNKGIALDLTLTDKNNKELKAQTTMHMLDTRSTVKYNNSTANKLRSIMTSQGFETLESEWWHFQENNYSSSPINTFHLK